MRTNFIKIPLYFLLLVLFLIPTSSFSADVISISITSSHSGYAGFSGKSDFVIHKTPKGYIGNLGLVDVNYNFEALKNEGLFVKKHNSKNSVWVINKEITTQEEVFGRIKNDYKETSTHSLPNELIELFVQSLFASPKTSLDISQFEISQEWLRETADKLIDNWIDPSKDYYLFLKNRKPQLIDKLSNMERVTEGISRYYNSLIMYDDYPTVETVITFSDGQTINLSSNAQQEYMIPWNVKNMNQEFTTYDIRISKNLYKLLPEKFLEKDRIGGNLINIFKKHVWSNEISEFYYAAKSDFKLQRSNKLNQK